MKNQFYFLLFAFIVLLLGCGGSDPDDTMFSNFPSSNDEVFEYEKDSIIYSDDLELENKNDVIIADDYFNPIFALFGLNMQDYLRNEPYGYFTGVNSKNQLLSLASLRKVDRKLVVAVYDSTQNKPIFSDSSIELPRTIIDPNNGEAVRLIAIRPTINRCDKGAILIVFATYPFYDCKSFGYFWDGEKVLCKELENVEGYSNLIPWYRNSCLLPTRDGFYYCITNRGEIKGKLSNVSSKSYPLSYTEYFSCDYIYGNSYWDSKIRLNKYTLDRQDWSTNVVLPDYISINAHVTTEVIGQTAETLRTKVNVVEQNGTKYDYIIKTDIKSGKSELE